MEAKEQKVYTFKHSLKWSLVFSMIVFVALAALSIGFLFMTKDRSFGTLIIGASGASLFSLLSIYSYRIVVKLPASSVVTDSDGIWLSHLSKREAMISWQKIADLKEHIIRQRLDLIGIEGKILLHIEYQLSNFEELREFIVKNAGIKQKIFPPQELSKSSFYHVLYFLSITGFSWLGWYVGDTSPILGYAGMTFVVIMLGYEYMTTVYCLLVDHHDCIIKYPIKSVRFQYNEILSVNLTDTFQKGARHPEVHITIKDRKKPFKLKNLGTDAVLLYKNMKQLLEKKQKPL